MHSKNTKDRRRIVIKLILTGLSAYLVGMFGEAGAQTMQVIIHFLSRHIG